MAKPRSLATGAPGTIKGSSSHTTKHSRRRNMTTYLTQVTAQGQVCVQKGKTRGLRGIGELSHLGLSSKALSLGKCRRGIPGYPYPPILLRTQFAIWALCCLGSLLWGLPTTHRHLLYNQKWPRYKVWTITWKQKYQEGFPRRDLRRERGTLHFLFLQAASWEEDVTTSLWQPYWTLRKQGWWSWGVSPEMMGSNAERHLTHRPPESPFKGLPKFHVY